MSIGSLVLLTAFISTAFEFPEAPSGNKDFTGEFLAGSICRQQSAPLNGIVTDAFHFPISDATVSLFSVERVIQTKSSSSGEFVFPSTPIGKYELQIEGAGFKMKNLGVIDSGNFQPNALSISLDIANPGCGDSYSIHYSAIDESLGGSVRVSVTESGRSLDKTSVQLFYTEGSVEYLGAKTGDSDEIKFDSLRPGRYEIRVGTTGFHELTTKSFYVTRENRTSIKVDLLKEGLIRICQ